MAWKVLCAALLPLTLCDFADRLAKLLAHLEKYRRKTRPTALERIRAKLTTAPG